MTFPMARTATCLLLLPIAFGCSGSEPGPGASSDPLRTESAFCAEWAEVACNDQVVEDCGGTATGCREAQKTACEDRLPSGYSSKHARECLDYVRDAYEDSVLTAEELAVMENLTGDCGRLIAGVTDEGVYCDEDTQCNTVAGYVCVIKPQDVGGTCQIPEESGPGEPCTREESVCSDGYYCDGSDCLSQKSEGDACEIDAGCEPPLQCAIPEGETEGTCERRVQSGETCTSNDDCETGLCVGADPICLTQVRLTGESVLCQELR
jgi:hypothetical protein